jgi:hypothetical protein
MPSLISSTEAAALRSGVVDLFDTAKRNIVIFKSPIANVVSTNDVLAGYGNTSAETTVEYTIVSGVYPAKIRHGRDQNNTVATETKTRLPAGTCRILVENDCREFIKKGKTESIVVDDITFNEINDEATKNFLGQRYYAFILNRTD